jgi:hypothetical protein
MAEGGGWTLIILYSQPTAVDTVVMKPWSWDRFSSHATVFEAFCIITYCPELFKA